MEPAHRCLKRCASIFDHVGAQNMREAFAKKQSHFMGFDIDPDKEIVVTCGSTEAMMAAMMTERLISLTNDSITNMIGELGEDDMLRLSADMDEITRIFSCNGEKS